MLSYKAILISNLRAYIKIKICYIFYSQNEPIIAQDDKLKGNGNSYDFQARIYDAKIGRFLSLDPMQEKYPNFSIYIYSANNPIL